MKNNRIKKMNGRNVLTLKGQNPLIGIREWFVAGDPEQAMRTASELKKLGINYLQASLPCVDNNQEDLESWFDWLIPFLSGNFDLFPCFLISPAGTSQNAIPDEYPGAIARFTEWFGQRYGSHFEYAGLCCGMANEGETAERLTGLVMKASLSFTKHGRKVVLAGVHPANLQWIGRLAKENALKDIDAIGMQETPEMPVSPGGWEKGLEQVRQTLRDHRLTSELWVSGTGYSTMNYDEKAQFEKFVRVAALPFERVYWCSLADQQSNDSGTAGAISGTIRHGGMMNADGSSKLLHRLWTAGGVENIIRHKWLLAPAKPSAGKGKQVLVTGGAGFIGTNLAHRLLREGYKVTVLDNLSRPGVEYNLRWLKEQYPELRVLIADMRDKRTVENAVANADHIFHFAGQVAVTSSLINPVHDFEVNVVGTINLLEAIRKSENRPSLIYTSTNKVYGDLADVELVNDGISYSPKSDRLRKSGIGESRPLDFHSPYGSSKGSADQYILDYARSFGLRNVVFRMSCIYGPHQFGNEDQGWVAHFILKALKKEKIVLYGDGMQVRDILYVDDLVNAFLKAWENIDAIRGEAFNVGGGPVNAISLLELVKILEEKQEIPISFEFENWRQGDQKYYVSDTAKFSKATGWKATISASHGIELLYNWLKRYRMNGHSARSSAFAEVVGQNSQPANTLAGSIRFTNKHL